MLQPCDDLRLGLEAADEVGVIGILGQDNLDGDVAPDHGLLGAKDRAEAAAADLLTEGVAVDGRAGQPG